MGRRTFLTGTALAVAGPTLAGPPPADLPAPRPSPPVCAAPSACTPAADSSTRPSPGWAVRLSPDTVSIDVPDGWVRRAEVENGTRPLVVVQEGAAGHAARPGISAGYSSPRTYLPFLSPPPLPDLDVGRIRDRSMKDALRTGTVTGAVALEGRAIGGSPAYGYAGMFSYLHGEAWHPAQSWLVWREDGMWSITVVGVEDSASIPAELVAALGTLAWAIPAPTTHAPAPPPRP